MQLLNALVLCMVYVVLAGLAVGLVYHRTLSHRALRLSPWFERTLVTLGLPAGTPVQWAGNHRRHHANTDQEGDPHSPRHGFWHAHNGWYIGQTHWVPCLAYALAGPLRTLFDGWHRPRSNQESVHLAPDVAADPYYRFVSRPGPYLAFAVAHVAGFYGAAWALGGTAGLVMLLATQILVYNLGDAIDSAAHLVGDRPFAVTHLATNHPWIAFLTFGEGWHANHHSFPRSPRTDIFRGQVDVIWWEIRLLALLGIASELQKPPSATDVRARLKDSVKDSPAHVPAR
ncbi:acyl-CoA desaturase [Archangium violaceum]|uniref:acyl-CoA desaturase n=1 Tax=Archangium violaceum TaxID=83451 RepID=UPI00126A609D|nr:acyl-CoA desaturase [Archangium violaceum]